MSWRVYANLSSEHGSWEALAVTSRAETRDCKNMQCLKACADLAALHLSAAWRGRLRPLTELRAQWPSSSSCATCRTSAASTFSCCACCSSFSSGFAHTLSQWLPAALSSAFHCVACLLWLASAHLLFDTCAAVVAALAAKPCNRPDRTLCLQLHWNSCLHYGACAFLPPDQCVSQSLTSVCSMHTCLSVSRTQP